MNIAGALLRRELLLSLRHGADTLAAVLFFLLAGALYPLAVWGLAQLAFQHRADGSLAHHQGRAVGSTLIGQRFTGRDWFHPRPSAAGPDGYDPLASGASDLGPDNPTLREEVRRRRAAVARAEDVPECRLLGSGIDGPALGWNTWLRSKPFANDADDAVFAGEEVFRMDAARSSH